MARKKKPTDPLEEIRGTSEYELYEAAQARVGHLRARRVEVQRQVDELRAAAGDGVDLVELNGTRYVVEGPTRTPLPQWRENRNRKEAALALVEDRPATVLADPLDDLPELLDELETLGDAIEIAAQVVEDARRAAQVAATPIAQQTEAALREEFGAALEQVGAAADRMLGLRAELQAAGLSENIVGGVGVEGARLRSWSLRDSSSRLNLMLRQCGR